MDRSDFLKNFVGAAAAPALLKDLLNITDDDKVVINEPGSKKRIAIDVDAITGLNISGPGGRKWTPKEIFDLYFTTGVLIYTSKRPNGTEITHHPITVLE